MITTKNDVIAFINSISESELHTLCDIINDYREKKKAESEFFRQMDIAEESIRSEGTLTSAELRASLGI